MARINVCITGSIPNAVKRDRGSDVTGAGRASLVMRSCASPMSPILRLAIIIARTPRHGATTREHALLSSYLLATAGMDTHVITDHRPPFLLEFDRLNLGKAVPAFGTTLPAGHLGWVILSPPAPSGRTGYGAMLAQAAASGARLALLNPVPGSWCLETLAPLPVADALVISGSDAADREARALAPPGARWRFEIWQPPQLPGPDDTGQRDSVAEPAHCFTPVDAAALETASPTLEQRTTHRLAVADLAEPDHAAMLLADILLRGASAIAPLPLHGPAAVSPAGGSPVWLISATQISAGEVLLSGRCDWPAMPDRLEAKGAGGPELPVSWQVASRQSGPMEAGGVTVEFHIVAPRGIVGHAVSLVGFAAGLPLAPAQRLRVERISAASPVLCGIEDDLAADGWRLLRGWAQAPRPLTSLRFSPDGENWFAAAMIDGSDSTGPAGRYSFHLEMPIPAPPNLATDPARCWMLFMDGDVAVDLLVGSPPRPGRHFHRPPAFGIANALQEVLAGLSMRLPGLRAIMVSDAALLADLAILPEESDVARLLLTGAGQPIPAVPRGMRAVPVPTDLAGLARQVQPVRDPWLETGVPVLILDAAGVAPTLLARALAEALPATQAAHLRLAVLVEAPPLEPLEALRRRLALPDGVMPLWPQALAAAPPAQIRAVVDLGGLPETSVAGAVAIMRGIPVALWAGLAPGEVRRPWPSLPLAEILALPPGAEWPAEAPYTALDALLSGPDAGSTG
jgi:hypothetical protein